MQKDQGALLVEVFLLLFLPEGVQSCNITVASPTIELGSPLRASCPSYCPNSGNFQVIWKLNGDVIPNSQYSNDWQNTSSVYFSSFNRSTGLLECFANSSDVPQLLDSIQINAGSLPSPPTNLSCLMNLTANILDCTWQLGRDSGLTTNVILHSSRQVMFGNFSEEQCEIPKQSKIICNHTKGQNSCNISRENFDNLKPLAVWVTVENQLGSATSEPLCVIPLHQVKVEPIVIKDAEPYEDCVILRWTNGKKAEFLRDLKCEMRYKSEFQMEWVKDEEATIGVKERTQCDLLSATKYNFQIRCIRKKLTGQWSEWGPVTSLTTLDGVPTGKLVAWWRMLETTPDAAVQIQLLWKPLKREEANANHIWYIVRNSTGLHQRDSIMCNTTALNCTFFLTHGMKRIFLWAYNTAGASPVTEISLSARNGTPVSGMQVSSNGDYSLRVVWDPQDSAKGYVVEWCNTAEEQNCEINWKAELEGSNSSILQGNIQPFKMYNVRLYALYEDCIGLPAHTEVYSKEGAPNFAPKLKLTTVSKSKAEVHWKPIPLEKRNGFITSYTIFWTDTLGKEYSSSVDGSSTKFEMKNLLPSTTYQVFLSSSTAGGSANGTALMIHTSSLDNEDIHLMLLVFFLFCSMMIIFMCVICIMKHKRLKNRFWPSVPDPAKSQMVKWASLIEEKPRMIFNIEEVAQTTTSDIVILERCQGKKPPAESETTVNSISSQDYFLTCNKQPSSTEDTNTWRSYINVETVQYAKVITEGYREQSPPTSMYVRSDSTQPLLCDVSPTPQNYENMWFQSNNQEDSVFLVEEENFANFPFLQALQIHEDREALSLFN
ncbi:granulocyte colony-stimulating factor receptor [Pseudophryne corroboree]|uniref:granulocyte colony-stimulating factor receptor n=1 Tax=Pseudophryne corroboree TaxID=495146 RepID=UPI003081BC26